MVLIYHWNNSACWALECNHTLRKRFRSAIPGVRHSHGPPNPNPNPNPITNPNPIPNPKARTVGMADPGNGGPVPRKNLLLCTVHSSLTLVDVVSQYSNDGGPREWGAGTKEKPPSMYRA